MLTLPKAEVNHTMVHQLCRWTGLAFKLKFVTLHPWQFYINCDSHVLNFSIAACCKLSEIRNMIMDTINSLFLFYNISPNRQTFLELILDVQSTDMRKNTHVRDFARLVGLGDMPVFETFAELYECVCISRGAILYPRLYPELKFVTPTDSTSEKWH